MFSASGRILNSREQVERFMELMKKARVGVQFAPQWVRDAAAKDEAEKDAARAAEKERQKKLKQRQREQEMLGILVGEEQAVQISSEEDEYDGVKDISGIAAEDSSGGNVSGINDSFGLVGMTRSDADLLATPARSQLPPSSSNGSGVGSMSLPNLPTPSWLLDGTFSPENPQLTPRVYFDDQQACWTLYTSVEQRMPYSEFMRH